MRVLHVIDGLGGSGGAERRFVEELEAWPAPDDHLVLRLFPADDLSDRLRAVGVETRSLGLRPDRGSWNWPLAAHRLRDEMRSWGPDVVHTSLFHADLAGQVAAARARIPVVSSIVSLRDEHASRRAVAMNRLRFAVARRTGARWRAVSNSAAANAEREGVTPARISVVPRGTRLRSSPPPCDRSRFGLPSDVRLVVYVARQAKTKEHATLVRAVDRVRRRHPEVHLVLAGHAGNASADLRAAVAATADPSTVHDLGFRDDAELLLACADLVCRPSKEEGFAAGILEAVAALVPVVASDIPPHREIAGPLDLATFVPVGSIDAWSAAIEAILDEPPSATELAARRERAMVFSTEAAATGLRALLASAAGIDAARPAPEPLP